MCNDILGLGGKEEVKAVKMPKAAIPAPPAPERRQDSGAIVAIGDADSAYDAERRRALASRATSRKGGSALGNLGSSSAVL